MGLEEALKLIRRVCQSHDTCQYCPLRDEYDDCYIQYNAAPENWKFKSDNVEPDFERLFM